MYIVHHEVYRYLLARVAYYGEAKSSKNTYRKACTLDRLPYLKFGGCAYRSDSGMRSIWLSYECVNAYHRYVYRYEYVYAYGKRTYAV